MSVKEPLFRRKGFSKNSDFIRSEIKKLIFDEDYDDYAKVVEEILKRCEMQRIYYYRGDILNALEDKKKINEEDKKKKNEKKKKQEKKKEDEENEEDKKKKNEKKKKQEKNEKNKEEDEENEKNEEEAEDTEEDETLEPIMKNLSNISIDDEKKLKGIVYTYLQKILEVLDLEKTEIKKILKNNCDTLDEANSIFEELDVEIDSWIEPTIQTAFDDLFDELKAKIKYKIVEK